MKRSLIHNKIIVAITGASGAIYGINLLSLLKSLGIETYLIISKSARITIASETKYSLDEVISLANHFYNPTDITAPIASGSCRTDGMIIAPCSMKTLSTIANGIEDNLISRAAGVVIKEQRKLILMTRETPLSPIYLKNMLTLSRLGVVISPPVPAFYNNPASIEDIINHSIARVLDLFEIDIKEIKRWKGL